MLDAFFHVVLQGSYLQAPGLHLGMLGFVLLVGSLSLILLFDDDLRRYIVCPETSNPMCAKKIKRNGVVNQDVARHRCCDGG